MIVDRETGLALDATTEPKTRGRPVLWTPHAAPWQQWRLQSMAGGCVRITSEANSMALSTDKRAGDGSWVWLDPLSADSAQTWRLKTTDDGAAFLIETGTSHYALDTGRDAESWTTPILWSSHQAPWQQWMICRLPLT